MTRGTEVVDVVERVPDGWYQVISVGSDLRMDVRRGHAGGTQVSVNGHRLRTGNVEDNPEVYEIFERYPNQFAAVVLIAREVLGWFGPGRYLVSPDGVTPMSNVFEDAGSGLVP